MDLIKKPAGKNRKYKLQKNMYIYNIINTYNLQ